MKQVWNAADYARNARFVADLGNDAFELLAPKPNERILDLGCGDGVLTARIFTAGAVVVGVDSSRELVASARARGLDAREIDGERLRFCAEFDAVFSNAALHWMPAADAVIAGVVRALRAGGRFVGELGCHGNVAAVRTALAAALAERGIDASARSPWYFPTAREYALQLEAHGFCVEMCTAIPRPTALPTGMRGWLETFAASFVYDLDAAARAKVFERVVALLTPILCDRAGNWTADYVRLRFAARLMESPSANGD